MASALDRKCWTKTPTFPSMRKVEVARVLRAFRTLAPRGHTLKLDVPSQTPIPCTCAALRLPASPAALVIPCPKSICRPPHRRATLSAIATPPFSSTPNKHCCHYIIQHYLLPSLNVGAAIATPPSHHLPALSPGCPRCCTCDCTSF